VQAIYWALNDPSRSDPFFERAFQIDASIGLPADPVAYADFYLSRLRRAKSRDEAFALLDDWLAELRNSTPGYYMPAVFALYGDTRTALELKSRTAELPGVPIIRFVDEFSQAVLASAQGQFDEAEQLVAALATFVRDYAIPRGEAACLVVFAKVALDRGDYASASRLLAVVKASVDPMERPVVTPLDALVYDHCTGVVGEVLDPEGPRTTHNEGSALSVKEALDAELIRSGATAVGNPAD
jgi:hypothetical protein